MKNGLTFQSSNSDLMREEKQCLSCMAELIKDLEDKQDELSKARLYILRDLYDMGLIFCVADNSIYHVDFETCPMEFPIGCKRGKI